MALGGVIPLIVVAICTAIFFKTFGGDFLRAANGGGLPAEIADARHDVLLPQRDQRRQRGATRS